MIYIGIDPGKSGGIAGIGSNGIYDAKPIPPTETDLLNAIKALAETGNCFCYLENVHAQPVTGKKANFTFGRNYGNIRMALLACKIPFETVAPSKWMAEFGMKYKKNESRTSYKNRLKAKAQEIFPLIGVMTHAIADALLIAEYCRRVRNET